MNARTLALAVSLALGLAACKAQTPQPPPATTPGASASTDAAPETLLGRKVKEAIDEARKELHASNLSLNNEFSFRNPQGRTIANTRGKPQDDPRPLAQITPQGDLLIDGRKVEVTQEQHALLVQYRGQILEIADAGMAMGVAGAELGGKAISGVAGMIFGGKQAQEEFEARMKAEGERLEAEGRRLCERMRPLVQTQQQLAAAIPAFAPYATMTEKDAEDCMRDNAEAVAASSPPAPIDESERARIREEIRREVREEIRRATQHATNGESQP